jgi:DNA-binding transcriptional LysR family regulator
VDVHLRNLRYFVAVAEELHFSRAAERLHVSQPALSKQVRQLEIELRYPLFIRNRHRVALTPAGEALLPAAQRLLADWAEAERAGKLAAAESDRLLRVGFKTSVGGNFYQEVASRFQELHPDWRLPMRLQPCSDPTTGLRSGASDVAFVWLPTGAEDEIATIPLRSERRFVALPASHRLASVAAVRMSDLLDEPFIALPAGSGPLRDFWLGNDGRGGREPIVSAEVEMPDEFYEAGANGVGIFLMAEGNTEVYRRPGLAFVRVTDLTPGWLAVAWRRGDDRPPVKEFVSLAVEIAHPDQQVAAAG